MAMQQHYVTFDSPGTFFSESSSKEIDSWDVNKAVEMSKSIEERYGARPYAFYFTTRARKDDELDARQIARSANYFLGGKISTIEEVFARNDPKEDILRSNMKNNNYDKIHETTSGWKSIHPFGKDDIHLANV